MNPRRLVGAVATLATAALLTSACGASSSATDNANKLSATETKGAKITWTPCGEDECGQIAVALDHASSSSPSINLSVYRRMATGKHPLGTLLLLPDNEDSARNLLDVMPTFIGAAVNRFNMVAISPRGSFDSAPMGCTYKAVDLYVTTPADAKTIADNCMAKNSQMWGHVSTLDSVGDVELIRTALGVRKAHVMAWGTGADIAATWAMLHPGSVAAAVLDSPADPTVPSLAAYTAHLTALENSTTASMYWCTGHISCGLNIDTHKRVQFVMHDMDQHKLALSDALLRIGSYRALYAGQYGGLFNAFTLAENGDASGFAALQDLTTTFTPASASPASATGTNPVLGLAQLCSNVTHEVATQMVAAADAQKFSQYPTGYDSSLAQICLNLPEPTHPMPTLVPSGHAKGAKVMVVSAAYDPFMPATSYATLATTMKWQVMQPASTRHLVLGYERAVTQAALDFVAK